MTACITCYTSELKTSSEPSCGHHSRNNRSYTLHFTLDRGGSLQNPRLFLRVLVGFLFAMTSTSPQISQHLQANRSATAKHFRNFEMPLEFNGI